MNQAPDRQVELLVARLLEPRLACIPPHEVLQVTQEAFAEIVAELGDDRERINRASEAVVLCVARRWGNIVQAGKASVLASRESAERIGLSPEQAIELATKGAARGVRQVGPVAFSQLRHELVNLVENFDELTALKGTPFIPREYPVIVPVDEDDWDFPSAEESWEDLRKSALPEPKTLKGWDFEEAEAPALKPRKSQRWAWLGLLLVLTALAFWLAH